MSVEIRIIGQSAYVTETLRVGDKVVKKHLGSADKPALAFLHRSSRLQATTKRGLREQVARWRKGSTSIELAMNRLVDYVEHHKTLAAAISFSGRQNPKMQHQPQSQTDEQQVQQDFETLPSAEEFDAICKRAELGDPDSIARVEYIVHRSPQLVDAICDLIELARKLVIADASGNSVLMAMGLHKRMRDNIEQLKQQQPDDLVHAMKAELVVLSHLDAMRCALQACKRYDSHSDAEHAQKLAERSLKRFQRAQAILGQD